MLRTKQKKATSTSVLVCDSGGHRLELDENGVDRLVTTLLFLCRNRKVARKYRQRLPKGADFQSNRTYFVASLQDLLSNVGNNVPSDVLAQVHHTLGITYQRLNNSTKAKKAFLQALWIQSSCSEVAPTHLGLTKVAIALEYGRSGDYQDAIRTLESAVRDFQRGGLEEYHEIWTLVSGATTTFHLAMEKNRILSSMQDSRGQRKRLMGKASSLPTVQDRTQIPRSKTPPPFASTARRSQI